MQTDKHLHEDLVRWRRHFHENPELSYEEHQTAAYIEVELRAIGVDCIAAPLPTCRVAEIRGTRPGPGRTVLLRADHDALPVAEAEGGVVCSKVPGVSHACGHDAHAAMLLGAAKLLAARRGEFSGTVRLVFQHGEESAPGGAFELVETGVLEGVDAAAAVHVVNEPVGRVRVCTERAATSACDDVEIRIKGCGTHASMPQSGVDPLLVGAHLILGLHTIVSRSIEPGRFAVVSPTIFRGGEAVNVIPHEAVLWVNVRTRDPEDRKTVLKRIETLAKTTAEGFGATAEVVPHLGCPAVVQDLAVVEAALALARRLLPSGRVATSGGWSASEDFSAYAEKVPAVYLFLGAGSPEEGYPYKNHHPAFRIDEACLETGARLEAELALELLEKGPFKKD